MPFCSAISTLGVSRLKKDEAIIIPAASARSAVIYLGLMFLNIKMKLAPKAVQKKQISEAISVCTAKGSEEK